MAIGDINNDGLPDLFFGGNQVNNELYLNKGNLKFEKISQKAGIQSDHWSAGAVMVDINKDGLLDIYVCNQGIEASKRINQLFINNGDLTFTERAKVYGIADENASTQAVFFDYDKDGDLDLYVLNHSTLNTPSTTDVVTTMKEVIEHSQDVEKLKKSSSKFYRNGGNGKFTDITLLTGIAKFGYGLGVVASDYACFSAGSVIPGFALEAPLRYVVLTRGFFGVPDDCVGPVSFVDDATFTFNPAVSAVNFNLISAIGDDDYEMEVFSGATSLGTVTVTSNGNTPVFTGFSTNNDATITSIEIVSPNGFGELFTDLTFGQLAPPVADTPIPTMGEWALMIFGLLIVNMAVFYVRRKQNILG